MNVSLVTVAILTNGSGAFSSTFPVPPGRLLQYRYVPGASPVDTNGDLDVTGATTGIVYVNQDNIGTTAFTKFPRQATHDETGAASLYAATGEPVETCAYVGGEQMTVAIVNGASGKAGTLHLWIG